METSFQASTVRGSVFVMIFIAIGLFAALSYALFHGGQVGEQSLTKEQSKLAAQEIIAYGDALANAVQTLRLRGCADTQFDFANTVWHREDAALKLPSGHNPSAPATGCSVFSASDGKMTPVVFPLSYSFDTVIGGRTVSKGHSSVIQVAMPGVGTGAPDLVLHYPNVKETLCLSINKTLGFTSLDAPPTHTITNRTTYNGTYNPVESITVDDSSFSGKSSYCAQISNNWRYYRILIAR
jgi:hypothetical protein